MTKGYRIILSLAKQLDLRRIFEYNLKNIYHIRMKIFPQETRHPHISNDIWIVENEQRMKELCLVEVGNVSSLRFPDPVLFLDHDLIFIWIFLCETGSIRK